jgi:uncharacterized membrane protein
MIAADDAAKDGARLTFTDNQPVSRPGRFAAIDVLRGVAVVAMVVYHTSWDLRANGFIDADVVNDPPWKIFARTIAGTFVALVGFNLVLATRRGFRPRPYFRRLALLAGAAALVSLATWWQDPDSFVFFGILHCILAASVLALPFLRAPLSVLTIGAILCLLAPHYLAGPAFDTPWLWWLGLTPTPPPTVDYVPILPWFGVLLGGMAAARIVLAGDGAARLAAWAPGGRLPRLVGLIGRWSLVIYLLHQPIIFETVGLVRRLVPPSEHAIATRFLGACNASCAAAGYGTPACAAYCDCALTGFRAGGVPLLGSEAALTDAQRAAMGAVVEECRPKPPSP